MRHLFLQLLKTPRHDRFVFFVAAFAVVEIRQPR